jgi:putative transposase
MEGRYDSAIRRRRSIRLKGYDYGQEGAYFVTICTHNRECTFGDVDDGEMRLSEYGVLVHDEWLRTAHLRPGVETDAFVIMPNHLHGVIFITEDRGVWQYAPTDALADPRWAFFPYAPAGTCRSPSQTIGAVVRGFKAASTRRINEVRHTPGTHVWQRNYYEHVIRE